MCGIKSNQLEYAFFCTSCDIYLKNSKLAALGQALTDYVFRGLALNKICAALSAKIIVGPRGFECSNCFRQARTQRYLSFPSK